LDSRAATATLALLTFVPGAAHAPRGVHFPGGDRWIVLARGQHGTSSWATGRFQSYATAVVAVAAAEAAVNRGLSPGVHHLHQVLTLADLPANSGIEVHDATHAA
ncbi:MAG: saccharopine dehydrogenase, partial [Acidimicrobiales bacterium]